MSGEWLANALHATQDSRMLRRLFLGLFLAVTRVATAQTVETPAPFDSAARLFVITPGVATRLGLTLPTWPPAGEYVDARLYSVSPGGGFVLVARTPSGVFQRFTLSEAERATLQRVIDAAVIASGRPGADVGTDVSEPAGNGFARHLTVLGALAYGPLAASLVDDESGAGAAYLAVTGLTFFISYNAGQSGRITRAQSDLAANMGLAAAAAGGLLGYSATGNGDKGVRLIALGSGIAGTVAGASLGRPLTDAEAHSAVAGIEATAAAGWALSSAVGASSRGIAAAVAGGEALGYAVGVRYPRRASFKVTAGDMNAVQTAGLIGALYGGAALTALDNRGPREIGITMGSSYLAGMLVGNYAIARREDLSTSEANIATVGAIAGGLIGLAVPVLTQSGDNSLAFGAAGFGATLGMAVTLGITKENRAGGASRLGSLPRSGWRITAPSASALAGLAARAPGRYPLLRVTF
jgi:hypothetical protein